MNLPCGAQMGREDAQEQCISFLRHPLMLILGMLLDDIISTTHTHTHSLSHTHTHTHTHTPTHNTTQHWHHTHTHHTQHWHTPHWHTHTTHTTHTHTQHTNHTPHTHTHTHTTQLLSSTCGGLLIGRVQHLSAVRRCGLLFLMMNQACLIT